MLHELLLALSGESGSIFVSKSKNGFQVAADLPFTHKSEVALLNRICRLGSQYQQLQIFIKRYIDITPSLKAKYGTGKVEDRKGPFGLYIQAYCTGLDQVLQAYRNDLVSLEYQVLKDPHLPLSYIEHKLEEYQILFPALLTVSEEIQTSNVSGCQILEVLFKSCICGVPSVKAALERILHVCHGVMYQQLSAWLLHGLLTDLHCEFFVTEITDKDGSDSAVEKSQKAIDSGTDLGIPGITGRQLAEIMEGEVKEEKPTYSKYRLRADMLPSYISPRVAEKILFIGESVKMFEGSQESSLLKVQYSVIHDHEEVFIRLLSALQRQPVFSHLAFESEIDKIRTCVAEHLWNLVVEEAQLLQHLKIIKGFFLLGRGELFSSFIEASRSLLKLPPTTTTSHDASALFQQVLHKFVPDDDEYCSLFSLTVTASTDESKKNNSSTDQSVLCGWDCVRLEYTVKWPLHIIFQESALEKYNTLFHYLLNVKRTQLDLQRVWAVYMANRNLQSNHMVHRTKLWLLRMHMAFLVDNLQYYLQVDVLEAQYTQLLDKIKSTRDFESIRLAHDHFLTTLMAQSFLLMKPVFHCLGEILNLCKSFSALLLQVSDDLSEREDTQIDSISKSYERQSSLLFKILSSVRSHQASPHLAQLLLRIDFNKHFSSGGYEKSVSGDQGHAT